MTKEELLLHVNALDPWVRRNRRFGFWLTVSVAVNVALAIALAVMLWWR